MLSGIGMIFVVKDVSGLLSYENCLQKLLVLLVHLKGKKGVQHILFYLC